MKIEIKNLSKLFHVPEPRGTEAFKNLNITIEEGEFLCIIGPNGCGKSTLLNILSGLDKPTSGEIKVSNGDKKSVSFGYMMQRDLLLPWRTVYRNILLGLEIQKKLNNNTKNIIEKYLMEFNLLGLKHFYPSTLSGGELQKVALIRTLVTEQDILLLDEPFSALDYDTRLIIEKTLYSLVKKNNITVLFVSHDIDEAIAMGDRILIFGHKPKGIISEHHINFDINDRDPIKSRHTSKFTDYFSEIWKNFPK